MYISVEERVPDELIAAIDGYQEYETCYNHCKKRICNASGCSDEIADSMKSYKKIVDDMINLICDKSKIERKDITKNCKPDWFLPVEQQISLGCVDKVLDSLDDILV